MIQNIDNKGFTDRGPEDIIVDLPYLPLVERTLDTLGVRVQKGSRKTDPTLDLGLITIEDVKTSADLIVTSYQEQESDKFPRRDDPQSNLDVILVVLRHYFRNADDGWCPEIGKNRTMNGVHGAPHIGGSGYPVAAVAPTLANGTGDRVRVGLIDTKIYPSEQFVGRVITLGDSLFEPGFSFTQLSGHSTFTTGLILQAAPGAAVIAKAVLDDVDAVATVWDVATAMVQFIDQNVSVLVLPLVCFTDDGEAPLALQRAVDVLRTKIVVVAAAGNHGAAEQVNGRAINRLPAFPASCAGAIAVGAVGTEPNGLKLADFSPDASWVQVVAPGDDVTSVFVSGDVKLRKVPGFPLPTDPKPFEGGATWSGTSFAAATFGGLIAHAVADGEGSAFEVADRMLADEPSKHGGVGAYGLL